MRKLYFILLCLGIFSGLKAQNLPSYLPANGLVGWWPFNGNANDESGSGNHGTVNGATLTADRFGIVGKAYGFDGVDDNISIAPSSSLNNFNNSISISAWIYSVGKGNPSYGNQDLQGIFGPATWLVNDGGFLFRLYDDVFDDVNQRVIQYGNGLPTLPVFSSEVVQTNSWENITCSYDGTRIRLYRNGIKTDSSTIGGGLTSSMNTGGRFYTIGQCIDWASTTVIQAFNGKLDDIAIYNRALTQQEITQLYQAGNETSLSYQLSQEKLGNCNDSPVKLSVQTSVKVKTDSAGSIGSNSATAYGTILNDGSKTITRRGFCWGTSANPTLSNSFSENGSGSGTFSGSLSALNPSTTYYLRAYAGTATEVWYGNELSFTTSGSTTSANCGTPNIHNPNLSYGSMTDQDGNSYKTIVIGTQEWMAENLKTGHYRNGDKIPVVTDGNSWGGLNSGGSCWYNNDSATYDCPYGRLYNWYAVVDSRNLCPSGWHVPSDSEWGTLEMFLGMASSEIFVYGEGRGIEQNVGGKLKSNSPFWSAANVGADNSSGFSGIPGGSRYPGNGSFFWHSNYGDWWSSTESTGSLAWSRQLDDYGGHVGRYDGDDKTQGYSVRCLKDASETGSINSLDCSGAVNTGTIYSGQATSGVTTTIAYTGGNGGSFGSRVITSTGVTGLTATLAAGNFASGDGSLSFNISGIPASNGTASFALNIGGQTCSFTCLVVANGSGVTDIDSNNYGSVIIGNQEWMTENLKVSKYRNGDAIPTNLSSTDWQNTTSGAYAIYNNTTYGKLYNWHAVADPRGLCPTGWHVPSYAEWTTIENFLGGSSVAGGKMKSTGTIEAGTGLWYSPNTNATNSSGFMGLAGGRFEGFDGVFSDAGFLGQLWSTTHYMTSAQSFSFGFDYFSGFSSWYNDDVQRGLSVRCLKD